MLELVLILEKSCYKMTTFFLKLYSSYYKINTYKH